MIPPRTAKSLEPGNTRSFARAGLEEKYGPWAVVTGASDGIGRAFALGLAERGINVVLVARRDEVLRSLAVELETTHGVRSLVVAADLADANGIDLVLNASRTLDVGMFVAAAGFGTSGALIFSDLKTELQMIDVNCRAVLALTHHFGARFVERRGGCIVLLSSIVAFQGVPRAANYAATKAYVQSLAEGLHFELSPFGITVLSIAPGPGDSGFGRRAGMAMGSAASPATVAHATLSSLRWGPTRRPGALAKLLGWSLGLFPRPLRIRVMALIMGSMTKGHR